MSGRENGPKIFALIDEESDWFVNKSCDVDAKLVRNAEPVRAGKVIGNRAACQHDLHTVLAPFDQGNGEVHTLHTATWVITQVHA